ncbi:three prime repair exonuclease 4 isoform X1 [Oncorhynchus nerka]|uniref:three prime repair exonuclease 4 isoform X1 n=1 Tax=Oncorhynchus nerka TaxID=8023 RepID=UPI0031B82206
MENENNRLVVATSPARSLVFFDLETTGLDCRHHVDGKRHQKLLAATASTSCGWEKASEATGSYSINIMWMGKGIRSYWQLQHQHHVDGKRHQKLLAATASTSCGWEKASEATASTSCGWEKASEATGSYSINIMWMGKGIRSYSINVMWMGKGIRSYWQLQHQHHVDGKRHQKQLAATASRSCGWEKASEATGSYSINIMWMGKGIRSNWQLQHQHHVDGKRHQKLLAATASTSCGWEKASEATGSYSINIMWMGKGIRSYSINIMWMGKGIRSYWQLQHQHHVDGKRHQKLQHQHHVDGKRHQKLLAATASTSCGWEKASEATASTSCGWEKASEATGSYSINIMWMGKGIRSYWQLQHQPQL